MKKKDVITFTPVDWALALLVAGSRRGNGKYNPSRLYQGFSNLTLNSKSARKCFNHER
jgi:hypothetical protein